MAVLFHVPAERVVVAEFLTAEDAALAMDLSTNVVHRFDFLVEVEIFGGCVEVETVCRSHVCGELADVRFPVAAVQAGDLVGVVGPIGVFLIAVRFG